MNFSAIQNFISKIFIKNASGSIINPATQEGQDQMIGKLDQIGGMVQAPFLQMENNEMGTYDTNLSKVFGSNPLVEDGGVKTKSGNFDLQGQNFRMTGLNSESKVPTKGFTTCNIQISGVWAGTMTFEISSDGGNFLPIAGVNAQTNTLLYTATGNGIYRFNVSGLASIKVRFSAFTSGTSIVNYNLSSGAQWQPFAQNAAGAVTIAGAVTEAILDANLPFIAPSIMYETGMELESIRRFDPTVNPTQPSTYAQPKFANYPQKFRRLRTQIGGSEMLPFAQERNTNKMIVTEPEMRALLELIYIELTNIRNVLIDPSSPPQ